jgi:acetyl-CoA synthetase
LKNGYFATQSLIDDLRQQVTEQIGNIAQMDEIIFTSELPKTQSGKTIRRLLQNVAEGGKDLGDTSTLANPAALEGLRRYMGHNKN